MQSTRSASAATAATSSGDVSGLNATPACSPCARAACDRRGHVVDRLVVERDAVAARLRDRLEVLRRVLDHQVHVHRAAALVDARRDRLQDDRPHRDRLDEVAVTDVEVEDAALRVEQRVDLVAEVREVGAVQRRLDLGASDPVRPAHARSYAAAR